jgi:hypothetical protein
MSTGLISPLALAEFGVGPGPGRRLEAAVVADDAWTRLSFEQESEQPLLEVVSDRPISLNAREPLASARVRSFSAVRKVVESVAGLALPRDVSRVEAPDAVALAVVVDARRPTPVLYVARVGEPVGPRAGPRLKSTGSRRGRRPDRCVRESAARRCLVVAIWHRRWLPEVQPVR